MLVNLFRSKLTPEAGADYQAPGAEREGHPQQVIQEARISKLVEVAVGDVHHRAEDQEVRPSPPEARPNNATRRWSRPKASRELSEAEVDTRSVLPRFSVTA